VRGLGFDSHPNQNVALVEPVTCSICFHFDGVEIILILRFLDFVTSFSLRPDVAFSGCRYVTRSQRGNGEHAKND
jgi:hypothetical protein